MCCFTLQCHLNSLTPLIHKQDNVVLLTSQYCIRQLIGIWTVCNLPSAYDANGVDHTRLPFVGMFALFYINSLESSESWFQCTCAWQFPGTFEESVQMRFCALANFEIFVCQICFFDLCIILSLFNKNKFRNKKIRVNSVNESLYRVKYEFLSHKLCVVIEEAFCHLICHNECCNIFLKSS